MIQIYIYKLIYTDFWLLLGERCYSYQNLPLKLIVCIIVWRYCLRSGTLVTQWGTACCNEMVNIKYFTFKNCMKKANNPFYDTQTVRRKIMRLWFLGWYKQSIQSLGFSAFLINFYSLTSVTFGHTVSFVQQPCIK